MRIPFVVAIASTATASLVAQPAAAQDRTAQLIDIIEANGCRMTEAEGEAVMPSYGFTMAEATAIAERLVDAGQARFEGQYFVLSTPGCATGGTFEARFLKVMGEFGCSMTYSAAQDVFPRIGFDFSAVEDHAIALVDAGQATVAEPDETLTLSAAICPS